MTAVLRRTPVSRTGLSAQQSRLPIAPRSTVVALLVLLSALFPTPGVAREPPIVPMEAQVLLKRADAAFEAGEGVRAQRLYRAVLVYDPNNSRAVYQLAQLEPKGSPAAIALLRRYLAYQPNDPWGRMALGDALAKSGAVDSAIEQYHRARRQAPNESDVYLGLGRILRNAGRKDELIANYEEWVVQQPKNAEAWLELGRARQKAQRYSEAADAYAQSLSLKHDDRTFGLLESALLEATVYLRPYVARSVDSDDNTITRWGLEGDWQFTERSRLGLHVEQANIADPFTSGTAAELAFIGRWQPRSLLGLDGVVGMTRLQANAAGQDATNHPLVRLRMRWSSPDAGPAMEVRFTENPLIATPGLVAQPVELTEVKAIVEAPLSGLLRARVGALSGRLDSDTDVNHRSGYQFGPFYRWQPAAVFGVFYSELEYAQATTAGYFAPQRVQTIELGTSIEYEPQWPVMFALDAGIGQQRVAQQGQEIGDWTRVLRFWGLMSWTIKPDMRLNLELEHSDSLVAGTAVTPTSSWSSNSVILSLRFGIRSQSARSFLTERNSRNGVVPPP